jgi:predicted Zn-dependent peptidase
MILIKNDFKTIQFSVYFTDFDEEDTRVYRFLLPKLLTSHTNKLINRQMMSEKLEDLYGAYFKVRTERIANLNIINIVLTIVDPKIVDDSKLLDQALEMFHQVLFERSSFNEDIFNEEKRMLIEQWETLKDKKRLYAQTKFFEHFFSHDPYGYPLSGKLKDIKKTTLPKLIDYYNNVFLSNMRKVVINGRIDIDDQKKIEKQLVRDTIMDMPFISKFRKPKDVRFFEEKTNMKQAIIKIGYHFPIFRKDELYHASVLLDTILGGYPDSRLFKEIREKSGLCYDISSSYDYYKGFIMISSGVDADNRENALLEIKNQVNLLINQGITEVELIQAKSYFIHQVKSSLDSQSTLTKRAFIRDLLNENETVEEKIEAIKAVTIEDVEKALKELTLDTIYVLYGGTNDKEII